MEFEETRKGLEVEDGKCKKKKGLRKEEKDEK